ncbi:MAG: ABC transporter permease [Planctomycetaceae bacterium]|nr:ABC transporter permease [Planctomycetaceae bacterium]
MEANSTMSQLMRWRLLGKELRQLWPIFGAMPLAFIGFLAMIFAMGQLFWGIGLPPWQLAYQLPGVVFAIGAASLLVCQEKEQFTLRWLAALPIPAHEIIRAKFWAGAIGVVVVWLGSILISLALHTWFPIDHSLSQWVLCLVINLYILLAGFAMGWRFESTFAALIVLLVVAFLPGAVTQVFSLLWDSLGAGTIRSVPFDTSTGLVLWLSYLAFGSVAIYLLHRWGRQALSATPTYASESIRPWLPYRVSAQVSTAAGLMSPASALTWQVLRQNRWALVSIGLLFATSFVQFALKGPELSVLGIAMLAASCLGVSTFAGDSHRSQVRFLADRGISRWQVWWSRQLVPFSMLSLYGLVAVVAAIFVYGQQLPTISMIGQLILIGLAHLLLVYSLSQWLGQQIQGPVLAAVLVPPIAIGAVGLVGYFLDALGIHPLFMLLIAVAPLSGTAIAMSAWMDRTLGFRSAIRQLSAAGLLLLLGGVVVAWPTLLPQQIDSQIAADMRALSVSLATEQAPKFGYPDDYRYDIIDMTELEETFNAAAKISPLFAMQNLRRLQRNLAGSDRAIKMDFYRLDGQPLETFAEYVPQHEMPASERRALFNEIIRTYLRMARGLRLSTRLVEQETADLAEIWLLRQVMAANNSELFEDELYNEVVAYLANEEARQLSRRQALAEIGLRLESKPISIWDLQDYSFEFEVSGIYFPFLPDWTAASANANRKRKTVELLEKLWVLSELVNDQQHAILKSLAENQQATETLYGIGSLGHYFRVDDAAEVMPDRRVGQGSLGLPGQQWRAGWELQAKQLELRGISPSDQPIHDSLGDSK